MNKDERTFVEAVENISTDELGHKWNVIPEEDFREYIRLVFDKVASVLSKSLGPYGATTFIEEYGSNYITKDGWQLLKRLNCENPVDTAILKLLKSVSAQVVIKVGDGSTTSVVAADEMLKAIESDTKLRNLRSKDLLDKINSVVDKLCKLILENASQIDKNGNYEEIKHLAMISTNGDEEISTMIQKIYQETDNPTISFATSKGTETKMEIIDGYKLQFMTYIDRIFINNEDGTSVQKHPLILMFDHRIDPEYYDKFIKPVLNYSVTNNKKLVVISPYYSKAVMDRLAIQVNTEYKTMRTTSVVYLKVPMTGKNAQDLYGDFAALCGCDIISEVQASNLLEKENTEEVYKELVSCLGTVEKMVVGERDTFITGFINKNDDVMKLRYNDAVSKYNEVLSNSIQFEIIDNTAFQFKDRVARLKCKMGTIEVGGPTELAKKANYDLVEDAVKACESAYIWGYNTGQNTAVLKAAKSLANITEGSEKNIIDDIVVAFVSVLRRIMSNKEDVSFNKALQVADNCVNDNKCFDLITDTYTDTIINSCMTDVEILKAVGSMVALLLSSNQFISLSKFM